MAKAQQKVHDFLSHHPLGILSTVSKDGKPWGSPVYYVVDDELHFYFVTRHDTLKYKNINRHHWASITIADSDSQITVQALGTISQVPVDQVLDIVLNKLERIKPRGDYQWVPPIMKVHKGDYMVLELTPTSLQYADFKRFKSDLHEDYIEKII